MTKLLDVRHLSKFYGKTAGCLDVSLDLHEGEVIGVVGESGSGKSTLLNCMAAKMKPTNGEVIFSAQERQIDLCTADEVVLRQILRSQIGFVTQNASDGLRMDISAGGNIGEKLMANGKRNYADIRKSAVRWLEAVEIDTSRMDDPPSTFSGGMQQRLQIAANLAIGPRIIFMDEPTASLDKKNRDTVMELIREAVTDHSCVIGVFHNKADQDEISHQAIDMAAA